MKISQPVLHQFVVIALAISLAGCSGKPSGGDRIDPGTSSESPLDEAPGQDTQIFTVNNSDGGESLQSALDAVQAGDTIVIQAGSSRYQHDASYPGESIRGFTLATSGTADQPIYIIGEGNDDQLRPIIDQGKTAPHNPDAPNENPEPTTGIHLLCASHIVIENVEIRNAHMAGITSSLGSCASSNIVIRNSHIHNIYGDRNVAGIRLSRTSSVTIENNELHDIFQTDSNNEPSIIAGSNAQIDTITIKNNKFSDMDTGIRLEAQNDKTLSTISVENNHFEVLNTAITGVIKKTDEATVASAMFNQLTIRNNLFLALDQGIEIDSGESLSQSDGLLIYNNTFHGLGNTALTVSGIDAISLYNNIFSDIDRDLLVARAPVNTSLSNSFSLYDYNLYSSSDYDSTTGPEWLIDLGGLNQQLFGNLINWKIAYSTSLNPALISDPDQASSFTDPLFQDPANNDFTPNAPVALSGGRQGEVLGAFGNGSTPGLQATVD